MDHDLKQRVVGAVVITALAAIFVPMLFDDPVLEDGRLINELQIPEPPTENFAKTSERLPQTPDQVLTLPEPPAIPTGNETQSDLQKNGKLERWVIQVGSFGERKNALLLQEKLRKKGFATFLDSVNKEGNSKLFRLKVGPELNKDRAEKIKKKLEKEHQLQAILVAE